MIAALTGATGYAGQFIARRLIAEGVQVRAWRRAGSAVTALPGVIEWIDGDLTRPETFGPLVAGAGMLVHAALQHAPGKYRGGEGDDPAGFVAANVGGSLALLEAARAAGVERCVVLSSRAVFGSTPRTGGLGDDARLDPDTHYGAAKASLEAFVRSWGAQGWGVAALRPTGIYGVVEPFDRTKWQPLVMLTLQGIVPQAARSGTEVHGADVAEAVWRLLEAPAAQAAGRAFNCSDIIISNRDVVAAVQRLTGRDEPLPPEAAEPDNIMDCAGLAVLGMRFGGRGLFEATIAEMVDRFRRP